MTCRLCHRAVYARELCRHHHELRRAFEAPDDYLQGQAQAFVDEQLNGDLMCHCPSPDPRRLGGIWHGLELYECTRCGRKLNAPAAAL